MSVRMAGNGENSVLYIIPEIWSVCHQRTSDLTKSISLPMFFFFLSKARNYSRSALNNGLNLSFAVPHLPPIFTSL